jgi:hypothetical protein
METKQQQQQVKRLPRRLKSKNIAMRKDIHMAAINEFFEDEKNFQVLYDFVTQNSSMSLRVLEYLCTKLAPERGIQYQRASDGELVILNSKYQDFLESQGKDFFDCFRRKKDRKFKFTKHDKTVLTTVAQLRFFRFAIRENVIEYAQQNFAMISSLMSENLKKERAARSERNKLRKEQEQKKAEEEKEKEGEKKAPAAAATLTRKRRRSASDLAGDNRGSTKKIKLSFKH